MSKRNRRPKAKLTIRPDGFAWLAKGCSPQEWQRILDLTDRQQTEAAFGYIRSITDANTYAAFEAVNCTAEELAERRRAAAARKQAEETAKRTIYFSAPEHTQADLVSGKGRWKDANLLVREKAEAAARAKAEASRLIPIPPAVY